ncbi:MAG: DUF3576 domain-containing protein [Hyphomonadaceae bacterium]
MSFRLLITASVLAAASLSACSSNARTPRTVVQEVEGGVNPYLWRASLDTLSFLPIATADSVGGLINYDWQAFEQVSNERVKATVFILDTRLRADGVKVSVFRQIRDANGTWVDADTDPETGIQLENKILERARALKASEVR